MQIDWKKVSASPGYKSLKAAYIDDVQDAAKSEAKGHRPMRNKAEFLKKFQWVINRAKHYADQENTTIDTILDAWEQKRGHQWYLNFYQGCQQQKVHSNSLKPCGIREIKKIYKINYKHDPRMGRVRMLEYIKRIHEPTKTGIKARWTPYQKETMRRKRQRAQQSL